MEEETTPTPTESVEATSTEEQTTSVNDLSDEEFALTLDNDIVEPVQEQDKPEVLHVIKRNGREYEITDMDELKQLANLGKDYTQKTQALAGSRKSIEFMEANGISQDDLDSLIASRGDTPKEVSQVDSVATQIMDSEYREQFQDTLTKLPKEFVSQMGEDANTMKAWYSDVADGTAAKILEYSGRIDRLMDLHGMNFVDAYRTVGKDVLGKQDKVAEKIKTLNAQPKANTQTLALDDMQDVWSMSDEEFRKTL